MINAAKQTRRVDAYKFWRTYAELRDLLSEWEGKYGAETTLQGLREALNSWEVGEKQ